MKINYQNGRMVVYSEYSSEFVKGAKRLNGKWNGDAWTFDERDKDRVNELLLTVYGENETQKEETVDIQLYLDGLENVEDAIELFGRVLVKRFNRDRSVVLHSSVIVLNGDFPKRGGSMRYPMLKAEEGTTLLVRDVPWSLYLKEKKNLGEAICLTEIPNHPDELESLKQEKERLLQRLAEIEAVLNQNSPKKD